MTGIVWLREDLRLADNPALHYAASQCEQLLLVYIWPQEDQNEWSYGAAKKWWLHHSLVSFQKSVEKIGGRLVVMHGDPLSCLKKVADVCEARLVVWNRRYDQAGIEIDTQIKAQLKEYDYSVESFPGNLLTEPWTIKKGDGLAYQVYTPYFRKVLECRELISDPLPAPRSLKGFKGEISGEVAIDHLELLPEIKWDTEFYESWQVGEPAALSALDGFLGSRITSYNEERDLPFKPGTSRMSPHLAMGEISPRQIWYAIEQKFGPVEKMKDKNLLQYAKEVVWREFAYSMLFNFPKTTNEPLRENFNKFPWQQDPKKLRAWQKGQTGYPIVDAGMRELWRTGWMHNRVRMIVASFLVKHLRIHWIEGARWFWDTLVDADLASNTLGWQWAAGCGADAAPYFRIFNPIIQGQKFDKAGQYTKHYVPELAKLEPKVLFEPWKVSPPAYPKPVVIHTQARIEALAAFEKTKGS